MRIKLMKLSKNYFNAFQSKDLSTLDTLLDNKIKLSDWEVNIKGKKKVLNFNKKIFKKFKKINIKIVNTASIFDKKKITFNQILISLDNNSISVIDVIYFNKRNKIIKIEAYKM